jgi:hypothetical protein
MASIRPIPGRPSLGGFYTAQAPITSPLDGRIVTALRIEDELLAFASGLQLCCGEPTPTRLHAQYRPVPMLKKIAEIRRQEIVQALNRAIKENGISMPSYGQIAGRSPTWAASVS